MRCAIRGTQCLVKGRHKSDKLDARKLADLLRTGMLRPVYHGPIRTRMQRELGRRFSVSPSSQDLNG